MWRGRQSIIRKKGYFAISQTEHLERMEEDNWYDKKVCNIYVALKNVIEITLTIPKCLGVADTIAYHLESKFDLVFENAFEMMDNLKWQPTADILDTAGNMVSPELIFIWGTCHMVRTSIVRSF